MRVANWNPHVADQEISNEVVRRMRMAASVVQLQAILALKQQLKGGWKQHGPYKKGVNKGKIWTARDLDTMIKTIRVTEKKEQWGFGVKIEDFNVWVMAGNFKTWWAAQMEYGRGGWKGGPRPFLRKAMKASMPRIKSIFENGE